MLHDRCLVSKEAVIQKIRALLARASEDSNDNPFEREIAIKHAHRLMEEHTLSMLEVTEEDLEEVSKAIMQIGTLYWKRSIVSMIASLYGCAVCWPSKRGSANFGSIYIYGRENNRITVETISEYVINSIEKEWQKLRKREKLKDGDKRSFCVGAVYGVRDTVKALKAARTDNAESSGQALALLNKYEELEKEAKEAVNVSSRVAPPAEVADMRLAARGRVHGRKVRLEPRLGKKTP